MSAYEEILAGCVALGYADCSLVEYAKGIKYFVDAESRKPNCDTHLINMLRRAACMGWELAGADSAAVEKIAELEARIESLTAQLAQAEELCDDATSTLNLEP